MAQQHIIHGTPEQLVKHLERLPHTGKYKMTVALEDQEALNDAPYAESQPDKTIEEFRKKGLRGVGMFAHVPGGSEEFAREKHEEIDLEDRPRS